MVVRWQALPVCRMHGTMAHVMTTDPSPTSTVTSRPRLDRPVLVGNLISGGALLFVAAFVGSWPLALIGAVYVVVASMFLAAAYSRDTLTRKQEALAWVLPWLVAVALWVGLLAVIDDGGTAGWGLSLWGAVVIATPCYLVWQLSALAVRQFRASRVSRT